MNSNIFSPKTSALPGWWGKGKNTEIAKPITIENNFVGVRISDDKIPTFLSALKFYMSPLGFRSCLFRENFDDDELFQLLQFLNRYCWIYKKTLVPTSVPGLFVFYNWNQTEFRYQRHLQSSGLVNRRRASSVLGDCLATKRWRGNDIAIPRNIPDQNFNSFKKEGIHYLFHPQILQFDPGCTLQRPPYKRHERCRCALPPRKLLTWRNSNNLLSSGNKDIRKCSPPKVPILTANLPFKFPETKLNVLVSPSARPSRCHPPENPELNYDEYLQAKSDELFQEKWEQFLECKLTEQRKRKAYLARLEDDTREVDIDKKENVGSTIWSPESSLVEKLIVKTLKLFQVDSNLEEERVSQVKKWRRRHPFKTQRYDRRSGRSQNEVNEEHFQRGDHCFGEVPIKIRRKSGVILTKDLYYCNPPISALDLLVNMDGNECFVNEFRVGHELFGHVTFHGETNVLDVNLDEIIVFTHKEFDLYPSENDGEEAKIGAGLRVPATVVLFQVWPKDKNSLGGRLIKDPAEIRHLKYEDLLKRSCDRMKVKFAYYKPEAGHWSFEINSFKL